MGYKSISYAQECATDFIQIEETNHGPSEASTGAWEVLTLINIIKMHLHVEKQYRTPCEVICACLSIC